MFFYGSEGVESLLRVCKWGTASGSKTCVEDVVVMRERDRVVSCVCIAGQYRVYRVLKGFKSW